MSLSSAWRWTSSIYEWVSVCTVNGADILENKSEECETYSQQIRFWIRKLFGRVRIVKLNKSTDLSTIYLNSNRRKIDGFKSKCVTSMWIVRLPCNKIVDTFNTINSFLAVIFQYSSFISVNKVRVKYVRICDNCWV